MTLGQPVFAALAVSWGELILAAFLVMVLMPGGLLSMILRRFWGGHERFRREIKDFEKGMKEGMAAARESHPRWGFRSLVYEALGVDNRTAEFIDQSQDEESPWRRLVVWVAQGFGAGNLRRFGSTWSSLFGILWFMAAIAPGNLTLYLVIVFLGIRGAIGLGRAAERMLSGDQTRTIMVERIAVVPLCFAAWIFRGAMDVGGVLKARDLLMGNAGLPILLVFAAFCLFDTLQPWTLLPWRGRPLGSRRMGRAFLAAALSNLVFLLPLGTW